MPRSGLANVTSTILSSYHSLLLMIFLCYGLQQGLCQSWLIIGRNYYFKDILLLNSFDAQLFVAITWVPLNIKPIYGILSDTLGICGYYRTPYLIFSSTCGIICPILLSYLQIRSSSAVCVLMMGINLSIAMSDVVIDATITIFAGNDEQIITNLHTFSSSCVTVCSIIGYLTSGIVIEMVGVLNLFFVSSIISFIVLISTLVGFLNEYPHNCKDKIFSFRSELYDRNPSLFFNALFVCCVALVLTILMVIYQSNLFNQIVILTLLSILLIFIPYFTLKSTSINAAKLSIILFTSDALTPNLETTMFYWYTNSINGPQFSSTYIGFINTFGYFVTFLGVIIFSKFFRDYSYNNLMIGAQIFLCFGGLLDILLVLKSHYPNFPYITFIPNSVLVLIGEPIIFPFFRRFKILPSLILSSKLCPVGAEATLYATFMSMINLGETIALYSGSILMKIMSTGEEKYSHLYLGIILKSCIRLLLLPILFYFNLNISNLSTEEFKDHVDVVNRKKKNRRKKSKKDD